jgi:hypothetical protein
MKKAIMIAAMAALMPVTSVWAGDGHGAAVPQSTQKLSSDRLKMEHERAKMSGKMSHKERGPMFNSTSKKSSDRLQGKREEMEHKMDGNKHGAMRNTTPHKHGHRIEESTDKD